MSESEMKNIPLQTDWDNLLNRWFYILLGIGILVNATGLLLPILEPDGCLYATISKTMLLSGDPVNLQVEGRDWLDKPHFPFWIAAISFKIFGINSFAYKLPAFLCWVLGGYYVFAWGKRFYNRHTAQLALLIYVAVEHLIIFNNDVRAEPYQTGLLMGAVYCFYRVYKEDRFIYIFYGALYMAAAIMTKGIFAAVMVAAGFIMFWIIHKKWQEFAKLRWWFACFLVMVFIIPELYCLYIQFDLHPEKIVFGKTGVSGLRFFFWDSQFGRFLNTGPIRGKGDLLFYVHTLLWAYLPWSFILIISLFVRSKSRHEEATEASLLLKSISIVGFIVFSLSRFQLPHYLNILYPFMALITADWLIGLQKQKVIQIIAYVQNGLCMLAIVASVLLLKFFNPAVFWPIISVLFILAAVGVTLFRTNALPSVIGRSFVIFMIVNGMLNTIFYPSLFMYQSGMEASRYLQEHPSGKSVTIMPQWSSEFALEFYSPVPVYYSSVPALGKFEDGVLLYASKIKADSLRAANYPIQTLKTFPHFHISQLTGTFLNQATRDRVLDSAELFFIRR